MAGARTLIEELDDILTTWQAKNNDLQKKRETFLEPFLKKYPQFVGAEETKAIIAEYASICSNLEATNPELAGLKRQVDRAEVELKEITEREDRFKENLRKDAVARFEQARADKPNTAKIIEFLRPYYHLHNDGFVMSMVMREIATLAPDAEGNTPLMVLAGCQDYDMVRHAVSGILSNCDLAAIQPQLDMIALKNKAGKTATVIAQETGNKWVADYLKNHVSHWSYYLVQREHSRLAEMKKNPTAAPAAAPDTQRKLSFNGSP